MKEGKSDGGKVVELQSQANQRRATKKWGVAAMNATGFCILPSLLIKAQARLGLNPTQFAVIIQLADMWWQPGSNPWPKKETIAARMKLSPRQFQRKIEELETFGYVKRIARIKGGRGQTSNEYDMSGLVKRLRELAPEFEKAKAEKLKVEKPGAKIGKSL